MLSRPGPTLARVAADNRLTPLARINAPTKNTPPNAVITYVEHELKGYTVDAPTIFTPVIVALVNIESDSEILMDYGGSYGEESFRRALWNVPTPNDLEDQAILSAKFDEFCAERGLDREQVYAAAPLTRTPLQSNPKPNRPVHRSHSPTEMSTATPSARPVRIGACCSRCAA